MNGEVSLFRDEGRLSAVPVSEAAKGKSLSAVTRPSGALICNRVLPFMLKGVSTRNYDPLLEEWSGGLGLKKSSVSKAFKKGSLKALQELNGRDLKPFRFVNLMIDGIEFGGRMVICALGITEEGKKWIPGLRSGGIQRREKKCPFLLRKTFFEAIRG